MNYLEIVLKGYFNDNNRKFLEKYFLREYKKAEKDDFLEADEFFSGCLEVIESFEKHLEDNVNERKRELTFMLINAKNGTLSFADLENKTIEQKRLETIEFCEQELKDVRPDGIGSLSFTVNLFSLTNGSIAYHLAYNEVLQIKISILKVFRHTHSNIEPLSTQSIVKQKPEPYGKLITFKNIETIEKIHSLLKGYFPNNEDKLFKALQGEQLSELLLFPHNQNRFVEVFRRLKYNGFLLNNDTETKKWICTTFQFVKKGFKEPQPFKESSVWDNLNKGKGEPTKKERICIDECKEWLPYKSPLQLKREAEQEKL